MRKRAFKVISGRRHIGAQGCPAEIVARYIRNRGLASGYGHDSYAAPGWRISEWSTAASRERYRQSMIADHCD